MHRNEIQTVIRFHLAGFVVIITALLMQACSDGGSLADAGYAPEIVNSVKPISGVEGFEIRYVGLKPQEIPFFGVGYAIWANYPYFTYAGNTYERAGVGGVIIRLKVVRPTRYLVAEEVGKRNTYFGTPVSSTLTITDKATQLVVAHRTLREGEVENNIGWVGQHAAEFVRKNLLTDAPIGVGGVGAKVYPRTPVEITTLQIGARHKHDSGCESTTSVPLRMPPATLDTPKWQFLPQSPIADFACSGGYILVLSYTFPNDLFLDVLTDGGGYVFQDEIEGPLNMDPQGIHVELDDVSLSDSTAEFNLLTSIVVQKGNRAETHLEHYEHVRMPITSHPVK